MLGATKVSKGKCINPHSHPPQAPTDTILKMASQIPPQAKPEEIESAHKHHALDQNTLYLNIDSCNFWSRKPDSYFLYKEKKS